MHIDGQTFTFPSVWPGPVWIEFLLRKDQNTLDEIVSGLVDGDEWEGQQRPWIYAAALGDHYQQLVKLLDGPDLEMLIGRLVLVYSDMMTVEMFNDGVVPTGFEEGKSGPLAEPVPASDGGS